MLHNGICMLVCVSPVPMKLVCRLTQNALIQNALTQKALTQNALTLSALIENAVLACLCMLQLANSTWHACVHESRAHNLVAA